MSSELNRWPRAPGAAGQPWDGVAAGWQKWWPVIEQGAQSVSQRMLELANVAPGHRVLDIATDDCTRYLVDVSPVLIPNTTVCAVGREW